MILFQQKQTNTHPPSYTNQRFKPNYKKKPKPNLYINYAFPNQKNFQAKTKIIKP